MPDPFRSCLARHTGQPWQTTLFLALLAAQLGVVLGLRERLFTRENPFLSWAVLAAVGLGAAALYVPFVRAVLETRRRPGPVWQRHSPRG
ncbi:putative membrane protein [Streptomyces canus]|uniref:cation transporting ATPase C-terminal domain-containing protein n=1 Tax=Streptomyces canus TaxID=58343 RepID=UPI002786C7C7|nr:cation transporting ATPase C-terminal domain-containing protein [Streptomyces canus]MDQ0596244.1 putative membrane protein [Streptomyces canus]